MRDDPWLILGQVAALIPMAKKEPAPRGIELPEK